MKKLSILLITLTIFLFSGITVSAADSAVVKRNVGGTKVTYSHWLTYMDTRCGVNTQSHYGAVSGSKLKKMNLSWKAYDVMTGNVADSNSFGYTNRLKIRDSSKRYLAIKKSQAKYKFSKGGSFWNPTSNVYHCTSKAKSANNDDDILESLKGLYTQNTQMKNNQVENENKTVKNIVSELFEEDYKGMLNEYTFSDGEKVELEDFNIQKVDAGNEKILSADGVQISNKEKDNSITIELKVPEKVYKNDNEFNLTGYIIFKDNEGERIDYGINGDMIHN